MDCCCAVTHVESEPTAVDTSTGVVNKLRIQSPELRCGSHISIANGYSKAISDSPCRCVQIYLGGNTSYKRTQLSAAEQEAIRTVCASTRKTVYIHSSLVTNLATPEPSRQKLSLDSLTIELQTASNIGAGCVLHVGKVGTLNNVAERINELAADGVLQRSRNSQIPYTLLLENAAGQGSELGRDWEELRRLYEGLDRSVIGLCIDTQHAFASGMCRFDTHESVVNLFDEADAIVRGGISMIHLNDSSKAYSSRVDRHAALSAGYIWNRELEGLASLARLSRSYGLDLVSETGCGANDSAVISAVLSASDSIDIEAQRLLQSK